MRFRPAATAALLAAATFVPQIAQGNPAETAWDKMLVWQSQNWWQLLVKASDEEATEYAAIFGETAAYLAKTDPQKCMQMILPSVFGPLGITGWPQQFYDRQMAIQRRIVRTSKTTPNTPPTEDQAGPVLDQILLVLIKRHGREVIDLLTKLNRDSPPLKTCTAWSDLYLEASKMPPVEGGMMIRWMNIPK